MRTRGRLKTLALISCGAILASCTKVSPAGFWRGYRSGVIVAQESDQGPWGGSRWIHWVARGSENFEISDVVQFAKDNGWTCKEPTVLSAGRTSNWMGNHRPVFPLFFGEPGGVVHYSGNDAFPRHIFDDSSLIQCETGWIRVAPGSGESSPAFGYIQVESGGNRLAVYHLWGEV
jgi:hypothetical protein